MNEVEPCICEDENSAFLQHFDSLGGLKYWLQCSICGRTGKEADTYEGAKKNWNEYMKEQQEEDK
jgi:hypothetical protein